MLASFSVVPMTTGESVSHLVAESLKIVDASGLDYQLGPMQTIVEGDEAKVMGDDHAVSSPPVRACAARADHDHHR